MPAKRPRLSGNRKGFFLALLKLNHGYINLYKLIPMPPDKIIVIHPGMNLSDLSISILSLFCCIVIKKWS